MTGNDNIFMPPVCIVLMSALFLSDTQSSHRHIIALRRTQVFGVPPNVGSISLTYKSDGTTQPTGLMSLLWIFTMNIITQASGRNTTAKIRPGVPRACIRFFLPSPAPGTLGTFHVEHT
ncbi:hypothetical protein PMIN04_004322 [Paraphaeosphaeria minitans]